MVKYRLLKIYCPILSLWFSGVKYIHIVVQHISRPFSFCKTETLFPLYQQSPITSSPQSLAMAIQFFMSMNLATLFVVVVQSLSRVQLLATPWTAARKPSLSVITRSLLILMSIESVMPSNHLALCHPLLLLPSIFPSIRVFSNESALHIRWPKFWSFSLSISPSNEYSGLISFRMDWLNLLAVQGTLKSLLQHHSSKASILQHSAFFVVQLSHPLEKAMATHSSILALKIPWTEDPGEL